jgi:hypothetical protein
MIFADLHPKLLALYQTILIVIPSCNPKLQLVMTREKLKHSSLVVRICLFRSVPVRL